MSALLRALLSPFRARPDWRVAWSRTWAVRTDAEGVRACLPVACSAPVDHWGVLKADGACEVEWRGWCPERGTLMGAAAWERPGAGIPPPLPARWLPVRFEGDPAWDERLPLPLPAPESERGWGLRALEDARRSAFLDACVDGAGAALEGRMRAQVEVFADAAAWLLGADPGTDVSPGRAALARVRFAREHPSLLCVVTPRPRPGRAALTPAEVDSGASPIRLLSRRLHLPPRLVKAAVLPCREAFRRPDSPAAALEAFALDPRLRAALLALPHDSARSLLSDRIARDALLRLLRDYGRPLVPGGWSRAYPAHEWGGNLVRNLRLPPGRDALVAWLSDREADMAHLADAVEDLERTLRGWAGQAEGDAVCRLIDALPALGMERVLLVSRRHLEAVLRDAEAAQPPLPALPPSWPVPGPPALSPEGVSLAFLSTPGELEREGRELGHCVGARHGHGCAAGWRAVLSLSGPGPLRSTADIVLGGNGGFSAREHRGPANRAPEPPHTDALAWWLEMAEEPGSPWDASTLRPFPRVSPWGAEQPARPWPAWRGILGTRAADPLEFARGLADSGAALPLSYDAALAAAERVVNPA